MSVLNRKMFNRGARKELRKKGGIEDIQYFQTAGAVNVPYYGQVLSQQPPIYPSRMSSMAGAQSARSPVQPRRFRKIPPYAKKTGGISLNLSGGPFAKSPPLMDDILYQDQNVNLAKGISSQMPTYSMNQILGQEGSYFKLPTKFDTPGDARIAQIVRRAATKGKGSLNALEMAELKSFQRGLEARGAGTGNIPLLNAVKKILEVGRPLQGFVEGAVQKAFLGDPAQGGIGGYFGSGTPSKEVIEGVGGEMLNMPTGLQELQKMQRAQQSKDVNIAPKGTVSTKKLYSGQEGRLSGEQDPDIDRIKQMYGGQEGRLADRIPGLFAERPNIDDDIAAQSREEIVNLLKKQKEGFEVSPPEGDTGGIAFKKKIQPESSFEEFEKLQKRPLTDEEKELVKLRSDLQKGELELEELIGQELGRGIERDPLLDQMITEKKGSKQVITDVTAENKKIDPKKVITEKENTVKITNPNTNEPELVNDPEENNVTVDEGGKTVSTPITRPDNWAEVVAKAKETTNVDSEPVTAKNLVKMENEEDTFSMEDYKAKILKLLPKYSENKAQNNAFYGAMIGFSIAAGASPNAITNIANGFKQVLPLILKDKQKQQQFEKEVELTAAKFSIQKANALDTQQNKRTSFFVKKPFTDPFTGEEYGFGHMKIMNEKTYDKYIKAGFGGQFTSESVIEEMIETNGAVQKARLANTGTEAFNKLYATPGTEEYFGHKVSIISPSAAGTIAGNKALFPQIAEDTKIVVNLYKDDIGGVQRNLDTINVLQGMLQTENITGVGGLLERFGDALKGATPQETKQYFTDQYGVDFDAFSASAMYEVQQRALTLELTPLLLGESAKTISDADRLLIARAMGFNATIKDGVFDIGQLQVFKNQAQMNKALKTVEDKLLEVAKEKNTEFENFLVKTGQTLGKPDVGQSQVAQVMGTYNIDFKNKTLNQITS